jgi:hypothetical protein
LRADFRPTHNLHQGIITVCVYNRDPSLLKELPSGAAVEQGCMLWLSAWFALLLKSLPLRNSRTIVGCGQS